MNRRTFIRTTATGSAAMLSAIPLRIHARNPAVTISLIGCGGYGMGLIRDALQTGEVFCAGLSDVDSERLENAAAEIENLQGSRPATHKDYNELLDISGLQAVIIATPPQWHALQFIAACEKGLAIFTEKPLAYDLDEIRVMRHVAEQSGNLVQVGFQRRQSRAFQKVKQLVEEGEIGNIHQVEAHIHYRPNLPDQNIQAPPASLDWDAWCGPAPMLPYRPSIGHRFWRLEKEYGNGHLVDWGVHHIDIIQQIMGWDMPASVYATGGIHRLKGQITSPDTLAVTIDYEDCSLVWRHRLWGSGELNTDQNNGILFYGDRATVFASDHRVVMRPADENHEQVELDLDSRDMRYRHVNEFIQAVKYNDRNFLSSPVEESYASTGTVLLAMASLHTNSLVRWDAAGQTIRDNPEALSWMARPYREPYKRPVI